MTTHVTTRTSALFETELHTIRVHMSYQRVREKNAMYVAVQIISKRQHILYGILVLMYIRSKCIVYVLYAVCKEHDILYIKTGLNQDRREAGKKP